MTLHIGRIWHLINEVLTTINIFLFGIISSGSFYLDKEKRDKIRIPLIANIILLAVLVLIMFAMYKIYLSPAGGISGFTA